MSTHVMIADQLKQRWRWEQPALIGLKSKFLDMVAFVGAPAHKLAELQADKNLSEFGVREKLRHWAGSGYLGDVKGTVHKTAIRLKCIDAERADLVKPKIDKADVVGAMLRQELRVHLRSLGKGERLSVLMGQSADPLYVAAMLEAPSTLTGINEEERSRIEQSYLETNFAAKARDLADEREATEHVATAAETALHAFRVESGLDQKQFEAWFKDVPSPTT